jgi:hypothetical protein
VIKEQVFGEEARLETIPRTDALTWSESVSAVSWASVAAGAVTAAALSLALFALGAGLGLSSISPWADSGVSAGTFRAAAGVYLVIVAVMSSAIGGYLAARLRTKWTSVHTNEVFFRDTAHGLVAWAFATVLSASVLSAAATYIVSGAVAGTAATASIAARNVDPTQVYVDRLFRTDTGTAPATPPTGQPAATGNNEAVRAEVTRLLAASFSDTNDLTPADRTYVARLVATQTGLPQAEAERRVNEVVAQAKEAADRARQGASKLAFWMTAALLFGAFAASLAAVEGGQLRDGTWEGQRLVPRPWR